MQRVCKICMDCGEIWHRLVPSLYLNDDGTIDDECLGYDGRVITAILDGNGLDGGGFVHGDGS